MRGISSPSYFETLGISLVSGRNFTVDEINQNLPVIVVNQTACQEAVAQSGCCRQAHLERARQRRKQIQRS